MMDILEIKKELHKIIDEADANILKGLYITLKNSPQSFEKTKMISDAEADIKRGHVYPHQQVKDTVRIWKDSITE